MMTWIRWQAACLGDDMRRWRTNWRERCRRWHHGEPSRHGSWQIYDTGQLDAIEDELTVREWLPPTPDDDWATDALPRAIAPRLFAAADTYWGEQFRDFFAWIAQQEAAANAWRAEVGLPPRQGAAMPSTIAIYGPARAAA